MQWTPQWIGALLLCFASAPSNALGQSDLARYPGFGHNPEADEVRFTREEQARERLISTCMQRSGFDYMPRVAVLDGESTTPEAALAVAMADPNERYANSLDSVRKAAYYQALYGVSDPFSEELPSGPAVPTSDSGGGCVGEARREIPGVYAVRSALTTEFLELRRAVGSDPRVQKAEDNWARCMWRRGFEHPSQEHMELAMDAYTSRQLTLATAGVGTLRSDSSSYAYVLGHPVSSAEVERLKESDEDLSLEAMASEAACRRTSASHQVVVEVQTELENAFVRDHRELLEVHLERMRRPPVP